MPPPQPINPRCSPPTSCSNLPQFGRMLRSALSEAPVKGGLQAAGDGRWRQWVGGEAEWRMGGTLFVPLTHQTTNVAHFLGKAAHILLVNNVTVKTGLPRVDRFLLPRADWTVHRMKEHGPHGWLPSMLHLLLRMALEPLLPASLLPALLASISPASLLTPGPLAGGRVEFEGQLNAASDEWPMCFQTLVVPGLLKVRLSSLLPSSLLLLLSSLLSSLLLSSLLSSLLLSSLLLSSLLLSSLPPSLLASISPASLLTPGPLAGGRVEFEGQLNAASDERPMCFQTLVVPGLLKTLVVPGLLKVRLSSLLPSSLLPPPLLPPLLPPPLLPPPLLPPPLLPPPVPPRLHLSRLPPHPWPASRRADSPPSSPPPSSLLLSSLLSSLLLSSLLLSSLLLSSLPPSLLASISPASLLTPGPLAGGRVEFEGQLNAASDERPMCFQTLVVPGLLKVRLSSLLPSSLLPPPLLPPLLPPPLLPPLLPPPLLPPPLLPPPVPPRLHLSRLPPHPWPASRRAGGV
ncbi:unnamed protein product [Closterium sp. Yama58-4]|nr:unnamed protein product [Closterium sp. Yama58-4]